MFYCHKSLSSLEKAGNVPRFQRILTSVCNFRTWEPLNFLTQLPFSHTETVVKFSNMAFFRQIMLHVLQCQNLGIHVTDLRSLILDRKGLGDISGHDFLP